MELRKENYLFDCVNQRGNFLLETVSRTRVGPPGPDHDAVADLLGVEGGDVTRVLSGVLRPCVLYLQPVTLLLRDHARPEHSKVDCLID